MRTSPDPAPNSLPVPAQSFLRFPLYPPSSSPRPSEDLADRGLSAPVTVRPSNPHSPPPLSASTSRLPSIPAPTTPRRSARLGLLQSDMPPSHWGAPDSRPSFLLGSTTSHPVTPHAASGSAPPSASFFRTRPLFVCTGNSFPPQALDRSTLRLARKMGYPRSPRSPASWAMFDDPWTRPTGAQSPFRPSLRRPLAARLSLPCSSSRLRQVPDCSRAPRARSSHCPIPCSTIPSSPLALPFSGSTISFHPG